MRAFRFDFGIDQPVLLVWAAGLLVGAAAWFGSGTPVAGAAIVVAVLLATASPSGALYATCAAIPLIFHPIAVGSLQLGLLELGILATAIGSVIRFAYDRVAGTRPAIAAWRAPGRVWLLPAALVAAGTLSLLWIPFDLHRAEALRSWRWIIVEPVMLFVLARMAIGRDGRSPLVLAVVLPAALVAADGMWQMARDSSNFSVDNVNRSTATYLHPNNLALYLERAFFLAFVPGMLTRNRGRWLLLGAAGMLLAGIGVTFSRGALLGLAAGGAVSLLAHPIRKGWSYLAGSLVCVGIGFRLLASQRLTGADSSGFVTTRRYLWRDAGHMLRDFPLTGIGLDQFLWLHQQRYIDPHIWSERYVSHPHNLMLDAWLSLGVAGLVLFSAFIAAGVWVIWTVRRGERKLDAFQVGALACLGAGLGHALVDNGYFLPDLAALTWLAIAIVTTRMSSRDA